MRKILLAFDGSHFSKGAIEFARQLNEKDPILLTAAFLPQIDYANLWSHSGGGKAGSVFIPLVEDEDAQAVVENIKRFESFCIKNNIEHRVHKDFLEFAVPALKKETRYADLLIISSETFYEQIGSETPNEYLKEILHLAECPVIVVPEYFEFPANNILSYDGSESSVYAIKQFTYLFPELTNSETILIYANSTEGEELPDEANIEELVARHFSNLIVLKFKANPKKYFTSWLLEKKGIILVSGAYGRSGFSRLFRKSFATETISAHRFPVFITHK